MKTDNAEICNLLDTIHKCLMCNETAYEYKENEYVCSDKQCNFTWMVKNGE